jgi:putative transposase
MADLFCFVKRRCAGSRGFVRCRTASRVDDRRIVSAIVFVIRNGLRWRDAPWEYGPHNTIMINAAHLKAHRTAASLLEKGLFPDGA